MKKKLAVILAAVMLTACAKAPENVKEKKHYENSEVAVTREMISPKELQSSSEKVLNKQQKQFRIDRARLELPSKISALEFTQISGFEKNYERVFDDMLGRELWSGEKVDKQTASKENGGMTTYSFRNESKKMYACTGDNGFITFIKPESFDDPYTTEAETVRVYDVSKGQTSGDKYRLTDGEYSIAEAVSFTEKWIKENYAKYEPDYEMKVKNVTVKKSGGSFCFAVCVGKKFEGVSLDSLAIIAQKDEQKKVKNTISKLDLTIHKRADVSSFTNGVGMIRPIVKSEINELLSLQSVMDICMDKFTAFNEISVKSIGLKYTAEPIYTESDKYKNAYYNPGRKFTSHILWELIVGTGEREKSDNKVRYIYVDAQTGEVEFDFDGITVT